MNQDELKQLVGTKAVEWIKDGMIVGLGTGSTVKYMQPDLCPAHRSQQAGPDHRYAKPHRHLIGGHQLQQAVAI